MKSFNINIAYAFQSIIILIWWIGIVQYDAFYEYFEFKGISKNIFYTFLVPDIIAISFPSIVLVYKSYPTLKFIILGAFIYASVFCLMASLTMGGGEISSVLMLLGTMFNFLLCYKTDFFRQSITDNNTINLLKTATQICFVWILFLVVIPFFILKIESKIPFQIEYNLQSASSVILFALFSIIGLWSGYVLSLYGKGTPLPVDSTKRLVIAGPYAYVRNPMAICGIGQGLCIALLTSSISILIYCCMGMFVWHYVVRKYEEEELSIKFGKEYDDYRKNIICWLPKLKKYKSRP